MTRQGNWGWRAPQCLTDAGSACWRDADGCIGREELVDDQRYTTTDQLVQHGAQLIPELDAIFASRDLEDWGQRLDQHELLWAAVATVPEVIDDPQLGEYDAFPTVTLPDGGSYRTIGVPFEVTGAEVRPRGTAPQIGEHTADVLSERGFTEDEVATLAANRVFG